MCGTRSKLSLHVSFFCPPLPPPPHTHTPATHTLKHTLSTIKVSVTHRDHCLGPRQPLVLGFALFRSLSLARAHQGKSCASHSNECWWGGGSGVWGPPSTAWKPPLPPDVVMNGMYPAAGLSSRSLGAPGSRSAGVLGGSCCPCHVHPARVGPVGRHRWRRHRHRDPGRRPRGECTQGGLRCCAQGE